MVAYYKVIISNMKDKLIHLKLEVPIVPIIINQIRPNLKFKTFILIIIKVVDVIIIMVKQ